MVTGATTAACGARKTPPKPSHKITDTNLAQQPEKKKSKINKMKHTHTQRARESSNKKPNARRKKQTNNSTGTDKQGQLYKHPDNNKKRKNGEERKGN